MKLGQAEHDVDSFKLGCLWPMDKLELQCVIVLSAANVRKGL
jgi:hypothetical protein